MAKKKDYSSLSTDELRVEIDDARQELMNLRFQMSTGELTDFTRLRQTRRMIARILTVLSDRERMGE
ncbi:MAG: rpmC [Chloroflexi bacterium]|jgi:large subunit ribosomal protein L29|nr:rpmC [Chloroflexota bacterium]